MHCSTFLFLLLSSFDSYVKKLDLLLNNHSRPGNWAMTRIMNYNVSREKQRDFSREMRSVVPKYGSHFGLLLKACPIAAYFCPENMSAAGKTTPSIQTANSCHS